MEEPARTAGRRLRSAPALSDVVDFLAAHAPFDAADRAELERLSDGVEIEYHLAGTTIFSAGSEPVADLRVVRSGAVEIVLEERLLDRLESGELFGHASMLSGLPPGFTARAAEDTLCYRIPAELARGLLARPEGMRFLARSLLRMPAAGPLSAPPAPLDATEQPVSALLRARPVVCAPATTLGEAARMMTDARQTCAIVDLGDGSLGVLTDRDLRARVVAENLPAQAPVSAAMTAPAYTCRPDRPAGELLLEMLERDVHHFPVVSAAGELLGVLSDSDLIAIETRSSFQLRKAIARARDVPELARAASGLRPLVLALHDARVAAASICAIYTTLVDALTRRALELAVAARDEQAPSFAWLALGSVSRREATPASDIDSAIVWFDGDDDDGARSYLEALGADVVAGLEACGLRRDPQGVTPASPLVVRSLQSWTRAVTSWLADPRQEQALILVSVFLDSRPVWGVHMGTPLSDTFRDAPRNEALLRLLARLALANRPPTGFLRGLVVEHSGEHRGRLDLKRGGLLPIADLARWAGMAAGLTSASTRERLRAAADAGTLAAGDARILEDAFELIGELRLDNQVRQLHAGLDPDDHLDPGALSELTLSHLKECFRAIAAVQRRVSRELSLGLR